MLERWRSLCQVAVAKHEVHGRQAVDLEHTTLPAQQASVDHWLPTEGMPRYFYRKQHTKSSQRP
jgi:hypothetical protein